MELGAERLRTLQRGVFLATSLATFMASLDLSIVNVAFPALEHSFPRDPTSTLSWIITGYGIVFGALLITAGRVADILGRRRIFLWGVLIFVLASATCGLAINVPMLLASRVLQGVGAAAMVPPSLALLIGVYPSEARAHIVALWSGVGALAVATGPTLGALLITAGGWRWAFAVNVPVGILALLFGRRTITETPRDLESEMPHLSSVVLLTCSLAALVLTVSEGPTWGWTSARVVGSGVLSLVAGSCFVWLSIRRDVSVLPFDMFHVRSFSVSTLAILLYAMGFFAMLLGNILFLTSVWHYSILMAGIAVTPSPVVVALISGPGGRLATRYGFRKVLLVGFLLFASGLGSFALNVTAHPALWAHWLPSTILAGLGIGLTFPILGAAGVSELEPSRYATGSAVAQTARQVGGAIGVAGLVVVLAPIAKGANAVETFHGLWWCCAALAVGAGISCIGLRGRARPSTRLLVGD
ncbi:MAG: MFS transporter [Acidimicrobiales bacterium]